MKIMIVGPGALGCLLAARLAQSGEQVFLLDHRPERAEFINRRGITIEAGGDERTIRMNVTTSASKSAEVDLVIVCVKAYQTVRAVEPLKPYLSDQANLLTLQNGLGNIEALSTLFESNRVWGGTTAQGATELGLGRIRHAGAGETVLAPLEPAGAERLNRVSDIFNRAGLSTRVTDDVMALIWSKLIINVGINPLTAIIRLLNGQLLDYEDSSDIMAEAVSEAVAVSRALKVKLLYPDALQRVREVARATAGNRASMLQDVLAKRPTEIDHINGAVVKKGLELGIPTPVNHTLTRLVKTIQASYGQTVQTA